MNVEAQALIPRTRKTTKRAVFPVPNPVKNLVQSFDY